MNQISNAGSHDLLTCFFEECESQFRFLEEQHGYLYLSGLAEYQKHYKIIKPYKNYTKSGAGAHESPFFAITRYERNEQAIEVLYGDKNYALEIFLYPDAIRRLSMQDVISAARGDVSGQKSLSHLTETSNIAQSLQWFAKAMRDNPKVIEPSDKLIRRAETMREALLEQGLRAHLKTLVEEASVRAAAAFATKDYARVVEILDNFEDYLNASDLKKLKIARTKIS